MDKRNLLRLRISNHVRQKDGGKTPTMCRQSSTQLHHQEGPIPSTTDRRSLEQATYGQILHKVGHQGCLSQHQNQGRRRIEDNLHHEIRHIPIFGYALWANQCTSGFPEMDQQDFAIIYRHMLHSIFGRCPHIFRQHGTTPKGCGRHYPSYQKARNETQTVKMRVSPTRNGIPRIHHQQRRSQSPPNQDRSHMGLEATYEKKAFRNSWDSATSIDDLSKDSAGQPNPYMTESRKMSNGNGGTKNKRRSTNCDNSYAQPQC